MSNVIVLGAGAAGLMCALTAARRGRQVLVLEKSNKIGNISKMNKMKQHEAR